MRRYHLAGLGAVLIVAVASSAGFSHSAAQADTAVPAAIETDGEDLRKIHHCMIRRMKHHSVGDVIDHIGALHGTAPKHDALQHRTRHGDVDHAAALAACRSETGNVPPAVTP